ncbi:MAG: phosphatase PAP2 family protein [Candidatus Lokiarchaeota archaeon]|nr:phosphatase PAP2 family protein [Candidatus Lokiarchaeota archaeon]
MSEKKEYLSKKALLIIGITWFAILIVGLILYFPFNEDFYSDSSTVQAIFKAITYLGEPVVFIIIAAILYLAYNKKFAKNLALSLLFSYYLNGLFKEIIQDSRPPANTDLTEELGVVESSYGFPSGHGQTAVAFWGYASCEFKDRYKYNDIPIIPIILSIIIFLVAISRIIIGVHDLQDMIGGLLLGIGFLLAFIYLEPIVTPQFNKLSFIMKLVLTVVVSLAFFLIGTFMFPRAYVQLATQNFPPDYPDAGAFSLVGGVLLGFGIGYLIEQEYVKYNPSELSNKKKLINLIIGLVMIFIVFLPLEYLIKIDSAFYRFFRYALVAFVLSYVVPLICTKIDSKL